MRCQRYKGLIVRETHSELREKTGCMSPTARCINCGYIEDSVVRANRVHSPAKKRSMPRVMVKKSRFVFINAHSGGY